MKNYLISAVLLVTLIGCGGEKKPDPVVTQPAPVSLRNVPLSQYDTATISIGGKEIDAYVADEQSEQADGLMYVKEGELAENQGMLFIFPDSQPRNFWMRNTLIPLDIAYLDESFKILNIREMQPLDESPQPSEGAARYAVEMNLGWFEKNGIKKGAKFDLSDALE